MQENEKSLTRLNWKEACAILGCGKTRFYSLVNKGLLPAYRLKGGARGLWVYEKDCLALKEKIGLSDLTCGA